MTARKQHEAIVERIEKLLEEKQSIADDIKEVYAEAKGNGFDPRALRAIIKLRAQDQGECEAHEAILETYMQALWML